VTARGHHRGTADFIALRASSVLLLPLAVWLLWSVVAHAGADFEAARAWAARPRNAILLALFLVIGAFHMRIGAAEILTDYLAGGSAAVIRLLNWLVCLMAAGAAVYAAVRLAF
jgi:succinate dehydrogenase / fumarate reductase membrane anchor subunit